MKINKRTIGILVITLITGSLIGYWIGHRSTPKPAHFDRLSGAHQQITTRRQAQWSTSADQQIWTCSMHPQIRQNEPGDCPICGMELIPLKDESDQSDHLEISMSPTAMQLANVSTGVVGKMKPVKMMRLNGKVETDERMVYSQSSHLPGRIEKLAVNFTGQLVSKGTPIAYVYSPNLVTAQEELFEAQKIKESQPALFKAAREKLRNWKLTDGQIDNILISDTPLESFPVLADVSGYVTKKMVNLGDYVRQGEAIFEIAGLSRVWVMFDVYESELAWVNKGNQVTFSVSSLPGEAFNGIISYIDPMIDPKTRVARARVEINNPELKLKPEMFVSGTIEATLPGKSQDIVVPKTAVMWTGKRSVVYVKSANENAVSFLMRQVTLGPDLGDYFFIEDGLKAGEEIAINGTFSIDAAAQLAGKPSMMNPAGGPAITGHNHGDQSKSGDMDMPQTNNEAPKVKSSEIPKAFKTQLTKVYQDYLTMKDAFVASDAGQVRNTTREVIASVKEVDMRLLKGDAHMTWMAQLEVLNTTLEAISQSDDIENQRSEFAKLNLAFYKSLKEFGLENASAYYQYCPMAERDKGAYWFSDSMEIRNPYFGDAMLGCGENREVIGEK
jgi:Cu(I)/Ag(I) efflux system membrane fusion protein